MANQKRYAPSAIEKFIEHHKHEYAIYLEAEPGCLTGIGTTVLIPYDDKYKSIVFQEVYETMYSSLVTMTQHNKLPQKYIDLIEDLVPIEY